LLALIRKGLSREAAYELVQQNAMKTWQAKHAGRNDADFLVQLAKGHLTAEDADGADVAARRPRLALGPPDHRSHVPALHPSPSRFSLIFRRSWIPHHRYEPARLHAAY